MTAESLHDIPGGNLKPPAISWRFKWLLSEKIPLYGRRTAQIRLAPLSFYKIQKLYSTIPFNELVELYAVTGGVPKYMEFFANDNTLMDNIARTVLNTSSLMILLHKKIVLI